MLDEPPCKSDTQNRVTKPSSRSSWRTTNATTAIPGPRFTRGLYLKELYVTAAARSAGVGVKLIEGIRALTKERGDTRVLWTTTEDNVGAQRFYERLGMQREKKVCYVMDVPS